MNGPPAAAAPALGPDDVYVYLHGNGALSAVDSGGHVHPVTLDEALAVVDSCRAVGGTAFAGWDDNPVPAAAIERIRADAGPVVRFGDARPPRVWDRGTDALMEAAANGSDAILDDLLARGGDVGHLDETGSSALHHAAAHGNVHAINVLVAAGADLDQVNHDGFTPLEMARATRQEASGDKLVELGARLDDEAGPTGPPVTFRRSHAGSMWYLALLPIPMLVTAAIVLWPFSLIDAAVLLAVAGAYLWALPPRSFWSGGVPRGIAGDRLLLRTLTGRTRMVDLADVTAAALAGAGNRRAYGGRTLLLAHPEGQPTDRRQLKRMGLPDPELDAIAGRFDRVIVVPVSAAHREQVILAVGNRLSALGVDLSANLRHQLTWARQTRPAP